MNHERVGQPQRMQEGPSPGPEEPVVRLRHILRGIDETQDESDDGWWETSPGAEFGAQKLAEVEALFWEVLSA